MTGEEPATGGDVRIAGHSVSAEETRAVEALGFCPQASALWHAVTPREHLELYAVLGGRQPRAAAAAAGRLLKSLDFEDHGDKYSQKLSGGTRRKLSVAIALISRPRVCVLDEPSAGMDPASRRALWEVLQRELRGNRCAAVVTTHAMEEAETLCDCIGILVRGRLRALGSPARLRSRYGREYGIEINLIEPGVGEGGRECGRGSRGDDVVEFISRRFPSARLRERLGGRLSFSLDIAQQGSGMGGQSGGVRPHIGQPALLVSAESAAEPSPLTGEATLENSTDGGNGAPPPGRGDREGTGAWGRSRRCGLILLAEVFESLEGARKALGIADYAVSLPSLEQVFLHFARVQESGE
uniref:ABC transporter domain-containing protein n=1 Tax=Chromera velia CCMP2878 TaxID=1169474 RepID=A0A0G4I4W0_9ALVE|eukprot:Cvel_10990.t1-p1 / transcript=Cvel_10990.t1 / gene=Cvel_10990 / organism=Chromera_velia_CCMP2878 / gene_product=ATP-binding cassette sub-family A member 2, putative / transcript_product=ATP-binding cassette sub-family A member 2, putative / location=Cvel_scaffold676:73120-74181(-) / protein_length=354 / sequence_SO=supercontig / SO=protein_coding / is_pseudo=false